MKSVKVKELMEWLDDSVRIIDRPRDFSWSEVEKLVEISEVEQTGDQELLEEKIKEFKERYIR